MAVGREQFRMRSRFDDPARVEDDDAIRVLDRRQAVRDDEGRPVFHEFSEALLDVAFRFRIQCRGCLVQDQDGRILEQRPANGDPLLLTARQ